MNVTLNKYDVQREYSIPPGLKELMTDISREVLREQPANIYLFIAKYLESLLDARNCCRAAAKAVNNTIAKGQLLAQVTKMYGIDVSAANEMCTKIQAAFRGYRTRKKLIEEGIIKEVKAIKPSVIH